MVAKRKLTNKQKVFIDEYLICFNGAQAARNAGYSKKTIYAISYENLRKPEIREEIDRRMAEIHMSSAEVLAEDGFIYFDFSHPDAINNLHLIKKIETKRTRRVEGKGEEAETWEDEWVKVELNDPQRALEMLGKYHKLFVDRKEHSGPDGGPIPIEVKVDDERYDRTISSLADALREVLPRSSDEENSAMGTTK
jgi:phage terminase small subunit